MKTRIGPVDDPLEREADQVADAVTSDRPVGTISGAPIAAVQRKCAACARGQGEDTAAQARGGSAAAPIEAASTVRAATAVAGSGMPLSARERAYFEPRFGQDLSGIRLHTHGAAPGPRLPSTHVPIPGDATLHLPVASTGPTPKRGGI